MKPRQKDSTLEMQTLSQCMDHAKKEGFIENFKVTRKGLETEDGRAVFQPDRVTIANFYRFEGYSDPGDNSVLYLIETDTHVKGMLIDAYDAYADATIAEFLATVNDIQKKPHRPHSFLRSMRRFLGLGRR